MRPRRSTVAVFAVVAVAWFGIGFASLVVAKYDLGEGLVRDVLDVIVVVAAFPVLHIFGERISSALEAIEATGHGRGHEASLWIAYLLIIASCSLMWATVAAGAHALAPQLRAFWAS